MRQTTFVVRGAAVTEMAKELVNLPLPWFVLPALWLLMLLHMVTQIETKQERIENLTVRVATMQTEHTESEAAAWAEVQEVLLEVEKKKATKSRAD